MRGDAFPLTGEVEADETYIGGKNTNRHWNKKSAIRFRAKAGLRDPGDRIGYRQGRSHWRDEHKGNVVARVIGSKDAPTIASFVESMSRVGQYGRDR